MICRFIAASIAAIAIAAPAFAKDSETEFDGFYVGGSIGYSFQSDDTGERILFDRGSNGSFGETITTSSGADAFSPGFCNGAATSTANSNYADDEDGVDFSARLGFRQADGQLRAWRRRRGREGQCARLRFGVRHNAGLLHHDP